MTDCKCGQKIVFAKKDDGRFIPLSLSAPTYRLVERGGEICAERTHDVLVSHFSTCSYVNDFTKGAKHG